MVMRMAKGFLCVLTFLVFFFGATILFAAFYSLDSALLSF